MSLSIFHYDANVPAITYFGPYKSCERVCSNVIVIISLTVTFEHKKKYTTLPTATVILVWGEIKLSFTFLSRASSYDTHILYYFLIFVYVIMNF